MRRFLILFFALVLGFMLYVTISASLQENVISATSNLWPDAWFRATLADAYCGFLTFYVWVAYKETRWIPRCGWLLAIILMGNIAMAGYVLRELYTLPSSDPLHRLLIRRR